MKAIILTIFVLTSSLAQAASEGALLNLCLLEAKQPPVDTKEFENAKGQVGADLLLHVQQTRGTLGAARQFIGYSSRLIGEPVRDPAELRALQIVLLAVPFSTLSDVFLSNSEFAQANHSLLQEVWTYRMTETNDAEPSALREVFAVKLSQQPDRPVMDIHKQALQLVINAQKQGWNRDALLRKATEG